MHHPRNQFETGAHTNVLTDQNSKNWNFFCINTWKELIDNYSQVQMPKNEVIITVHVWGCKKIVILKTLRCDMTKNEIWLYQDFFWC